MTVRQRDITWGGRIRVTYQPAVWKIAQKAAVEKTEGGEPGSTLASSAFTIRLSFLDGGVRDTRGWFDSTCGMFWYGRLAKAYVVYSLGYDAREVFKDATLPSLRQLKRQLKEQHES